MRVCTILHVFYAIAYNEVYGPFLFVEQTINGSIFLAMVTAWLLPKLQKYSPNLILQMEGAPPHYHLDVRAELNQLPGRWIGSAGSNVHLN